MADAAVIFDVDGVLLELTSAEEDAFFVPFEIRHGLKNLSRDWNSYAIRNDENIIAEILASHGIPARERSEVVADYLEILKLRLSNGVIGTITIPGAHKLLKNLQGNSRIGIATASLLGAAELRLKHVNPWPYVCAHAFGVEGGGPKREILARAIASINLPKDRIVYLDQDDFGLNQSKIINVIEINNLEHVLIAKPLRTLAGHALEVSFQ